MSRVLNIGDFRTRREGVNVLRTATDRYAVTRPGSQLRVEFYRDGPRAWGVDLYNNDKPLLRTFADNREAAEDVATAVLVGNKTYMVWYNIATVITDKELAQGVTV